MNMNVQNHYYVVQILPHLPKRGRTKGVVHSSGKAKAQINLTKAV